MKSFKLLLQIFRDLFIRFIPFSVHYDYRYAFLVHPRDITDVYRKFPFFKVFPKKVTEWYCRHFWPVVVSKITGLKSFKDGKEIFGYIISIPMTAKQMIENRNIALKRLIQACKLSEKFGVKMIGLGALTSSLSGGGTMLTGHTNAGITTGHALTTYTVVKNGLDVLEILGIEKKDVHVAIVGAAGSIGSSSAMILAQKGISNFILVDLERKKDLIDRLIPKMKAINPNVDVLISHHINDIKESHLIIAATNAPEALIKSEDLRLGAVVIDDAQPSDVDPSLLKNRKDVIILDGGVINIPEVFTHLNLGLVDINDTYSCLGEVVCLAADRYQGNYCIGRTNLEKIEKIIKMAEKLNIHRKYFQNVGYKYTEDDIRKIKELLDNV